MDYSNLFHQQYPDAKKVSEAEYLVVCHQHADKDPSLSVNPTKGVWRCLACHAKGSITKLPKMTQVVQPALSNSTRFPREIYTYTLADGTPYMRVIKVRQSDGSKKVYVEGYRAGKWQKGLANEKDYPLYNLPEVLTEPFVIVLEGEKDVEALRKLGYTATTCAFGARAWKERYNPIFAGKEVLLIPDQDKPGRSHMHEIAYALRPLANSVRLLTLDVGEKGDVSDFLALGSEKSEELRRLIKDAPTFPYEDAAGWIEKLNKRYACTQLGSKGIVLDETIDPHTGQPIVDFLDKQTFTFLVDGATDWLKHPARRRYEKVIFVPREMPMHYFNLWRGFAFEPKENPALIQKFWKHVEDNICDGNWHQFNWFKAWCAQMVQRPWEPAATAIVLRGDQGTGKSLTAVTLGKLLGPHFLHTSSTEQFLGRFNSQLHKTILLFGDEAFWGGDKKSAGTIKRLITEETNTIEYKGKDLQTVPNYVHLIMASNETWVVPAGLSERRFAVFEMAKEHALDRAYFQPIVDDLKAGGYAALLYDLLNFDYESLGIDPKEIPDTAALTEQKELSASSEVKFLLHVAESGSLLPEWGDETILPFSHFYDVYTTWTKIERCYPVSSRAFGRLLTKMFGPHTGKQRLTVGKQYYNTRVYQIDSFDNFEHKVNELLEQPR